MPSEPKLPPIDFKSDVEKFEAKSETTKVSLQKCSHRDVQYTDGGLVCKCGAGWQGARLNDLYDLLKGDRT